MKAAAGAAGRATTPGDTGGGTAPVSARQMIGTYAVQIAKALGAQVTGVCSTAKTDLVTSIGADHVLDSPAMTSRTGPSATTSSWTSPATRRWPGCGAR